MSLQDEIARFYRAKAQAQSWEEEMKDAQDMILSAMPGKSASAVVGDMKVTVTRASNVRVNINDARLKKELGARLFAKVCKLVVDKEKLEDAVARREVDANIVAMCSEEVPSREFLRTNVKKAEAPQVMEKAAPTMGVARKIRKPRSA